MAISMPVAMPIVAQVAQPIVPSVGWTPASLFAAGEPGAWYDPSDFSTMFQDDAGTTPVTATGQTVGRILDKSGRGNHATQATSGRRPLLQQDASGYYYLLFDGSDDGLVSSTITPGTDKAQVFAGVRKLSDSSGAMLVEHGSGGVASNAGAFSLAAPNAISPGANYRADVRGDGTAGGTGYSATTFTSPTTNILAVCFDIAGAARATEIPTLRVNSATPSLTAVGNGVAGSGDFLAYPLYIGRRAGTSLPFNGRLYGLIVRFGANLDTATISSAETWVNSKTGAY